MSERKDLEAVTEAAWVGFRTRVADHLEAMTVGDVLFVDYADDVSDAASYVQASVEEDGSLRLVDAARTLLDTYDARRVDEVAVLMVRALREVYAVPHPAFLDAGGLEVDPDAPLLAAPAVVLPEPGADGEELALEGIPIGPDHLQLMVDAAMRDVFPDLRHDADGDIPIVAGRSVVFIGVLGSRPGIELYAEIVLGVEHLDRVDQEIALLNGSHPLWKFAWRDGNVVMTHETPAVPFSALALKHVVRQFVDEVDEIAAQLVARVGGHRFAEPSRVEPEHELLMEGLLELLHLDRVRPATVAGLFDHDRLEIIRQLVRIRRGEQSCGDLDEDAVLGALRKALRFVADGEQPAAAVPSRVRPHSVQESLVEGFGDDEALDLGWSA